MKVAVAILFLIFLCSCDIMRYGKGELRRKEKAISAVGFDLRACFSLEEMYPEISFVIKRSRPSLTEGIKRFGYAVEKSIESNTRGNPGCIWKSLREVKIPILDLADEEIIKINWSKDNGQWIVIPDQRFL